MAILLVRRLVLPVALGSLVAAGLALVWNGLTQPELYDGLPSASGFLTPAILLSVFELFGVLLLWASSKLKVFHASSLGSALLFVITGAFFGVLLVLPLFEPSLEAAIDLILAAVCGGSGAVIWRFFNRDAFAP
jgi:hypothetical protein